ncbi:cytochrome c3 family protein [Roseibium sp.]|uniref:cytochrome c3 family protein n=1 Tax=Roseibium sp. TaxID=1936156 RepID=UPI003D0F45B2
MPVTCYSGIATLACLVAAAPAMGQGIDATRHDLRGGGVSQICVFCHTPHAANGDIDAPLWNKPATGATYTTYDSSISSSLDGAVLAVGSVSIACLTCHDGTQSTDIVINGPGRANFGLAGIALRGGDRFLDPDQSYTLGVDLSNDHPIGIQYGGYAPGGNGPIDPDFKTEGGASPGLQSAEINGQTQWWVDTEIAPNGTRDKSDMILYARNNNGSVEPFVECGSCHDPHSDTNELFLRIANDNGQVCQACHVK